MGGVTIVYSLFSDFRKFEKILKNYNGEGVLNLSNENFLAPTTLLPILHYGKRIGANYKVKDNSGQYVKRVLGLTEHTSTTVPFTEIKNEDNLVFDFYCLFPKDFREFMGKNNLIFLIEEMVNNIYDHSNFSIAHTLAQHYPYGNAVDICFIDNGLSIPGNFEKYGFNFENDEDAIDQAINGKSTKIDEGYRGTGLNNTINLVTKGFGGSVLIASRNGLVYITKNNKYKLHIKHNFIQGTLISFRLEMKIDKDVNFNSYVSHNIRI